MVVIAVLGFTAIQKFKVMNDSVEEVTTNYMIALGHIGEMRSAILHYRLVLTKGVLTKVSAGDVNTLDKSLADWIAALAVPEAKYAPTVVTDEEKALYAEYQTSWKVYLEATRQTLNLLRAGKFDDAIDHLNQMTARGEHVDAALTRDVKFNVDRPGM